MPNFTHIDFKYRGALPNIVFYITLPRYFYGLKKYNYFLEFMRISEIVKHTDTNSAKMKKVEEAGVVLDVI
jgi:hypothetical protein